MTEEQRAAIIEAADRQERERCCAIITSRDGMKVCDLASYIAFETAIPAEQALPILAIARGAIDAAVAVGRQSEAWSRANVRAEISIHSH